MAFYQFSIKNPLETQQQQFTSITKRILIAIKSILKSAAIKFTSPKVHNGSTTSNRGGSLRKILEQIPSTKTEQHLSSNRLTRANENIRTTIFYRMSLNIVAQPRGYVVAGALRLRDLDFRSQGNYSTTLPARFDRRDGKRRAFFFLHRIGVKVKGDFLLMPLWLPLCSMFPLFQTDHFT